MEIGDVSVAIKLRAEGRPADSRPMQFPADGHLGVNYVEEIARCQKAA